MTSRIYTCLYIISFSLVNINNGKELDGFTRTLEWIACKSQVHCSHHSLSNVGLHVILIFKVTNSKKSSLKIIMKKIKLWYKSLVDGDLYWFSQRHRRQHALKINTVVGNEYHFINKAFAWVGRVFGGWNNLVELTNMWWVVKSIFQITFFFFFAPVTRELERRARQEVRQ